MISELQLINGCKENNPLAQRELYERYCRKMMGVCLRYSTDKMEAEDILQDGFIKVFKNINGFKNTGSLEGWIRKIIVNTALEHYRKNKQLKELNDLSAVENVIDDADDVMATISANELLKVIQRLPAGYRMVFNLFAIEGYKHEEIAEKLNISIGTSKSQFLRAKNHLQKIILTELA